MLDTGLWIPDNKECLFVLSSIEYQASSIASPQAMEENALPLVGLRRSFAKMMMDINKLSSRIIGAATCPVKLLED